MSEYKITPYARTRSGIATSWMIYQDKDQSFAQVYSERNAKDIVEAMVLLEESRKD